MPTSDLDVLSKLLRPTWRGIAFDCTGFEMSGDHDQTIHKFPDRDGGLVEATGRNNVAWRFQALFRNGVAGSEDAYPTRWRSFVAACADRSVGILVHPELGDIRVKPKSFVTVWDANKRDGVDMQLEFTEAEADGEELLAALGRTGNAYVTEARKLDDALGAMNPTPTLPDELKPSLLDSIKQLSGLLTQVRLGVGNATAQIDAMTGALGDLRESIEAADNPSNYRVLEAIDALVGSLLDLSETVTARARPIAPAVVQHDGALAAVAAFFGNTLDELLRLNPLLASSTRVAAGTTVFVYVA